MKNHFHSKGAPVMRDTVKKRLTIPNRSLRILPGRLMLGPMGARLSADYLLPVPGFMGRFDLIHKMNLPLLFAVSLRGREPRLEPIRAEWMPDETVFRYTDDEIILTEHKWITWADQAVSWQIWENRTGREMTLELLLPEGASMPRDGLAGAYAFPCAVHGLHPVMRVLTDSNWENGTFTLPPHGTAEFTIAAAVGLRDDEKTLEDGLRALFAQGASGEALLKNHSRTYMAWFDGVPDFDCSDELMTNCWWYRWYLLRANLAQPDTGFFRHQTLFEGRSHRMDKQPYTTTGWEFSRLIPLSTPLQITDGRWSAHGKIFREVIRTLCDSAGENGAFKVMAADEKTKEYANYAAWALYQFYLNDGDTAFVREVLPAFKRDTEAVFHENKGQNDNLQISYIHALTGKEYQPSYWYFSDPAFPDKVRGTKEGYTPLKRVDRSVYEYLNLLGLGRLCKACGDAEAERYLQLAEQVKTDVLDKMWDRESGFFYDLHYLTDEKAFVKNIVGIYPFWAEITDDTHACAIDTLLDDRYFALGSGFASAAKDCPAFSACGGWKGDFFKGRNGCMWNGPSWPYTTGIALDALAKHSRRTNHRYDADFFRVLHEYTLEHFRGEDASQPYLVEFYDSITGEPLSDEPDYLHSYYIDLIIAHLAGITATETGFLFDPLQTPLRYFSVADLQIRGNRISVYYQREDIRKYPEYSAGYTVIVNGELVWTCQAPLRKEFPL
jgi:hypothetical protein